MPDVTTLSSVVGHALKLGGDKPLAIKSAEGGRAYAEVVTVKLGSDKPGKKHLGVVRYDDITVQAGVPLPKQISDWIRSTWQGQPNKQSGALVTFDTQSKHVGEQEFSDAILAETTFPTMDAASKEPGYVTLKIKPSTTRTKKATGEAVQPSAVAQKQWLPSNFRLEIAGLDCSKVNKIEALTVKTAVQEPMAGELRDPTKDVTKLDFPNLVVTLAESHADAWNAWFEDFVVRGNCNEDKEKSGTLSLLASDGRQELGSLAFKNLGIFKLAPVKTDSLGIRRVKAEMYCERIEFSAV